MRIDKNQGRTEVDIGELKQKKMHVYILLKTNRPYRDISPTGAYFILEHWFADMCVGLWIYGGLFDLSGF